MFGKNDVTVNRGHVVMSCDGNIIQSNKGRTSLS